MAKSLKVGFVEGFKAITPTFINILDFCTVIGINFFIYNTAIFIKKTDFFTFLCDQVKKKGAGRKKF